jgi:hypothetical protein
MLKAVSRLGAFVFSVFAAELAHADMPFPCFSCSDNGACVYQFGAGWYYCGTDADGWYWCCPMGG